MGIRSPWESWGGWESLWKLDGWEGATPLVPAISVALVAVEVPAPNCTTSTPSVQKIKSSKSKEATFILPKSSGIRGKSIMYRATEQQQSKKNKRE